MIEWPMAPETKLNPGGSSSCSSMQGANRPESRVAEWRLPEPAKQTESLFPPHDALRRATKDLVASANARADLVVLCLGVTLLVELGLHAIRSTDCKDKTRAYERSEQRTTKPNGVSEQVYVSQSWGARRQFGSFAPLTFVRDDIDFDARRLKQVDKKSVGRPWDKRAASRYLLSTSTEQGAVVESAVDNMFDVALKAVAEVLEHRRSSGENDVLRVR